MDSYINSLFASNVNKVSKKQVMREIEIKAKKLNTIVDKIEGMFIKDDITVKDLVSSFIIPEIDRKKVEDKIDSEERRFIEQAKETIHLSVKTAGKELFMIKENEEE
jgi:ribosomal protein L22